MSESADDKDAQAAVCSNCRAPLTGQYCAQCGQSRQSIAQPAFQLFQDIIDSALSWDGRLVTTIRDLYMMPGAVARHYMDGRRAQFAPPFRLYVVVSILFFILIPLSGIAVIGIVPSAAVTGNLQTAGETAIEGDELTDINIVLFRPPSVARPPGLSAEDMRQYEGAGATNSLQYRMLLDPAEAEARLSAAAAKAMLSMVIIFALINAILHPKRQLINHAVYSLYFHAAMMPLLAIGVIGGAFGQSLLGPVGLIVTIVIGIAIFLLSWLGERRFYGTSIVGASLRMMATVILYFSAMLGILLGFAMLTI